MSPPLDATEDPGDWITAPTPGTATPGTASTVMPRPAPSGVQDAGAEDPGDWITVPHQNMVDAAGNAAFQGLVSGTGSAIAGVGRQFDRAATGTTQRQLATMDAIDRGETVPDQADPLGYQYLSAEQRAKARADLAEAATEQAKHEPNALERAGETLQKSAPIWYPVEPQAEGHVTNVARMLGGMVPAIGAGALGTAVGGPVGGVLGTASLIGAQSYDETYQEAIANGATHEQADDAAGMAAMVQMATMSIPVGRVLPLIPVSQRVGFLKTVVNLAQRGVELATGNELATLAHNYVASQTYDPARPLFKGSGDNAVDNFLTGLIIHGAGRPFAAISRPAPAEVADRVMGAPTVDAAINAATDAAGGQGGGAPDATGGAPQPSWGDLFSRAPPRPPEAPTESGGASGDGWRPVGRDEVFPPGGRFRMNQTTGQTEVYEPASPTPGTATAQPAGAEATSAPIPPKTRAQAARDLRTAVQQTAEDRAGPQLEDHTIYVPGVERTLAAREFNAENARDEKRAIAIDPEFRDQIDALNRKNNQIMVDLLRNDAGDPISLDKAHEEREQVSPSALHVFDNESPVDAQPFLEEIDRVLAGQAGKRTAVQRTLGSVRDSLYTPDGDLENLPSQLYGVRQNITDMLKKGVKGIGPEADDVRASKAILMGLLDRIDPLISQGAPKFADEYLPKFTEASQPINQQEFLQRYDSGARALTGQDGYLQLGKVQKLLADIEDGRAARGAHPAKSLTDEQIGHIIAVRNELAANSLRDRLAAVKGSDTFQQLMAEQEAPLSPTGAAMRGAGTLGMHAALLHSPAAVWGNAALGGYQGIYKPWRQARREQQARAAMAARKAELLETNRGYVEAP